MSDSPFIYGPPTVFVAPWAEPDADPLGDVAAAVRATEDAAHPDSGWTLLFPTCPDVPPSE